MSCAIFSFAWGLLGFATGGTLGIVLAACLFAAPRDDDDH